MRKRRRVLRNGGKRKRLQSRYCFLNEITVSEQAKFPYDHLAKLAKPVDKYR